MKKILPAGSAFVIVLLSCAAAWYFSRNNLVKSSALTTAAAGDNPPLKLYATDVLSFARRHDYNTNFCFLADMRMASGKNRFFVYNMQKDSLLDKGLVTHGRCNKTWLNGRQYGNKVGCGCTSLGKYKIGNPYHGRFGLAFKLHGLDSSNNNAFKRYVVLHAHECVPEQESDPFPICQSDGCPTVSPGFLQKLAGMIRSSPKPVLLYIFDSNHKQETVKL